MRKMKKENNAMHAKNADSETKEMEIGRGEGAPRERENHHRWREYSSLLAAMASVPSPLAMLPLRAVAIGPLGSSPRAVTSFSDMNEGGPRPL